MLATIEIVDVLDSSEHIGQMILQSDVMDAYQTAKKQLEEDDEAQRLIRDFQKIKDQYEDVQRFGRYHPDYNRIMKEVRTVKREMDMNEKVASFKLRERDLQKLLDEVSQHVAFSVSENIKVPRDGMALTDSGCGCGTGGGCGCAS
ncbi:Cell fate regulator YlbF, YheA/YmcA/DUF963 family (controls sporulation, competence, biofilm development) [Thalassobacillus cyri]|uniref:Cell fate regulator YlbF, YheA/YmcA/DUF963 family (Controls sporulation, competence, biofilm development) n=1 Tax=Thalassobacillus cyri TaxID=571932 RepID=A0A1H4H5Q9_9BACI|nr:YlbF family regulator [Thalassobacillus cyri]SEB17124.1 Cell fate regulator YlbF, YheA/YmcA/DUF963 family (controls sporulation, competence, biofilm development) [Thalassobacillus cyri]